MRTIANGIAGQSVCALSARLAVLVAAILVVIATSGAAQSDAVLPGANVNMVSGTTWPDGDPFLQRQNEPSLAVSTRNPLHLLGGANDYRTVDLPGLADGKETGDSWLGVFESGDGGGSWTSTLIPCYPQADAGACLSSPVFGYEAAADPVVRAGTHGLFYYSGIVFDRGTPAPSAAFVARFMDLNNDTADPIQHIDTVLVDSNPGDAFIDKTWLEVDVPRSGAQTVILNVPQGNDTVSQTVQCGNVYMAWASITGEGAALRTDIMFSRSTDCGGTWSTPIPLSPIDTVGQGATIAIAPATGRVHVAWRQFRSATLDCVPGGSGFWKTEPDAWPVESIVMGGITYTKAQAIDILRAPSKGDATYILAFQLIPAKLNTLSGAVNAAISGVIGDADAWLASHPLGSKPSQPAKDEGLALKDQLETFNEGTAGPEPCTATATGHPDAILAVHSDDGGQSFSPPLEVAEVSPFDQATSEYSFRTNAYPTMTVDQSGRAYLAWATRGLATPSADPVAGDSRIVVTTSNDGLTWTTPQTIDQPGVPGHQLFPSLTSNAGKLLMIYNDYRADASELFERFVVDVLSPERPMRHTVDIRAALADPADVPEFTDYSILRPSSQVSRYPFIVTGSSASDAASQQLQWNPPNLPMFELGTKAFFGDYLDVAGAPHFVPNDDGSWSHNTAPSTAPVFHATWTDNRDVVGPPDGDWTSYTPPGDGGTSIFDGSTVPACNPSADFDRTQMRNQNVYTSRLTSGLFVAVPSNARPLTTDFQRAFVLFVQNGTEQTRHFLLEILNQPSGGTASFEPSALVTQALVEIGAFSSISSTVFVSSDDASASVDVRVQEADLGGLPVDGGLESTVRINPDTSNPPPTNPALAAGEVYNPAVFNPAVFNPAVYNPAVYNPAVFNPAVFNLDLSNAVLNYDVSNPAVYNPAVLNPAVYNPAVFNQAVFNQAVTTLALLNPAVYNPAVLNPAVYNPAVLNPAVFNPAVLNPAVLNPAVFNPAVLNPAVFNPAVLNPAVYNSTLSASSITEANFVAENAGNATMAYSFNLRLEDQTPGLRYQLMIYRLYFTPVANGCELTEAAQHELLVNDLDPNLNANLLDPEDGVSFYLDPGERAVATLRVIPDPEAPAPGDPQGFDPGGLSVSVVSHAPNPDGTGGGDDQPPFDAIVGSDVEPLEITTSTLPSGVVGSAYASVTLMATGGAGPRTWSVAPGSTLPPGLLLSTSGVLSGTATASGSFNVVIRVTDETQLAERTFSLDILSSVAPLHFAYQGIVDQTDGAPGSAPFDAFFGETIRVEYTFDPATADTNPSGNGDYPGAVTALTVTVGPYVYTATSGTIIVRNEPPGPDQYEVDVPIGLSGPPIGGVPVDRIQIILTDATQSYFSSDALPTTPPDPAGFSSPVIQLQFSDAPPTSRYGLIQANNVALTGGGLTFVTQPAGTATVETRLGIVQVRLTDSTNAVLPGFTVDMALVSDDNSGTLLPPNPQSVTGSVGVADFPILLVTAAGSGYRLLATAGGVAALSDPFDIVAPLVAWNDGELTENGSATNLSGATLRVGVGADPSQGDGRNTFLSFRLPDLGPVVDPFTSAAMTITVLSLVVGDGFDFNVDLYAFPPRPGWELPLLGTDVYYEGSWPDSNAAMTPLQDNFITAVGAPGEVSTSVLGSANLAAYLNQQYAGGAGIGEYVFLRLNPDADNGAVEEGFDLFSAESLIPPTLSYTIGP